MNLATMRFRSMAMRRHVTYNAILPTEGEGPFPVILQLHGYSDDHLDWLYQSNLARYAEQYPFIIVLPDGGTSHYLDHDPAPDPQSRIGLQRYESYLIQDLREHVMKFLPAREGRWGIGGLSMGGFGAMRLGCKYPDLFASIWAHSGVYHSLDDLKDLVQHPEDTTIFTHIDHLAQTNPDLKITFDCGEDDELVVHNRILHRYMVERGISHDYFEHEGEHDWNYWDKHIKEALEQHKQILLGGA
jgi:putative tributyrin esterase